MDLSRLKSPAMTILSHYYNAGSLYIGYSDGLHECCETIEDDQIKALLMEAGVIRGYFTMWVLIDEENGPKWFHYASFIREIGVIEVGRILTLFLNKKALSHEAF